MILSNLNPNFVSSQYSLIVSRPTLSLQSSTVWLHPKITLFEMHPIILRFFECKRFDLLLTSHWLSHLVSNVINIFFPKHAKKCIIQHFLVYSPKFLKCGFTAKIRTLKFVKILGLQQKPIWNCEKVKRQEEKKRGEK